MATTLIDVRTRLTIRRVVTPADRARAKLQSAWNSQFFIDGVFEGGGALGAAYIGSLRWLESNGYWFARAAGNSAGAITAALISAGFNAQEIQWLMSAHENHDPAPATLADIKITEPINFSDFLDLSKINTISLASKRKTHLWHALHGSVIDTIGGIRIPIPRRNELITTAIDSVGSVIPLPPPLKDGVKAALNVGLGSIPDVDLYVRDAIGATTGVIGGVALSPVIREKMADFLWDEIAKINPVQVILTNLLHEGGIFEGRVFLEALRILLAKKLVPGYSKNLPAPKTYLNCLKKIPLAVITTDIEQGRMQVYSTATHTQHPDVDIAEAVRRSMSVPIVFESRTVRSTDGTVAAQFVDGGLCSNFPLWLMTTAGNSYWPANSINAARLKIGFTVDENAPPNSNWSAADGRFKINSNTHRVDINDVIELTLTERLIDNGIDPALADLCARSITGRVSSLFEALPKTQLITDLFKIFFNGLMITEDSTRALIIDELMKYSSYVDVKIPLLGFHGADFDVNSDEAALLAMWDRGWKATTAGFEEASRLGRYKIPAVISARPGGLKIESPFGP